MIREIYRSEDYCRGVAPLTNGDSELLRKLSGSEVVLETIRFRPEPECFIGVYHLKPEDVTVRFVHTPHMTGDPNFARSSISVYGSNRNIGAAGKRIIEYLRKNKPAPVVRGHKGYCEAQSQ